MYAVVEAGGRQYELKSGIYVDVDMVAGEPQTDFVFDKVLMIVNGDESMVGKPVLSGAKVTGKIISHGRGKKMIVYKYRAKKGTRKRTGHRQGYTRIFIDSIVVNDKVLSEAKDAGKKAAPVASEAKKESAKGAKAEKAPAAKAAKTEAKGAEKASTKKASESKKAPSKSTKKEDK